jgi:hypothetical protein
MKLIVRLTALPLLITLLALAIGPLGPGSARAQDVTATPEADSRGSALATTVAYVVQFYPLWFTYYQSQYASINHLVGPDRISPLYQIVVAINNDTLYTSTFLDLEAQPVILTIPATTATYSVLTLDPYGDIFESGIQPQTPGTYGFTGPGWTGTLPAGVTPIAMPLDFTTLIFRADKFSASGEDQKAEAERFRASLKTQTLSDYLNDPSGGATSILPEVAFAVPFKTTADELIAKDAITFLQQLQTAVASSNTPPMSPYEQRLSSRFDRLFGSGDFDPSSAQDSAQRAAFMAGAQAAHKLIVERYLTHRGLTNWIHFTNIGAWGHRGIERASITEFCQYCNGISTAAYFHAFKDGQGALLNGSNPDGYVLTFPAGQLPEAERFWSLTAYTPHSIELVDNSANKYVVASYTHGLQTNPDGSLSVYMAQSSRRAYPRPTGSRCPSGRSTSCSASTAPRGAWRTIRMSPPVSRVSDRTLVSTAQSRAKIPHPCAKRFQPLDEEA